MARIADAVLDELESEERTADSMRLLVRTGLGLRAAMERTEEAALAAWAEYDGFKFERWMSTVAPTTAGPVIYVSDAFDLADRLPGLAAALDAAGLPDAQVEVFRSNGPRVVDLVAPVVFLECRLAVRGVQVGPEPEYGIAYWVVPPEDRAALVRLAVRWCLALPGVEAAYLDARMVMDRVAASDLAELAEVAVDTVFGRGPADGNQVRLFAEAGSVFRMAVLSLESAHLSFVEGTTQRAGFDWGASMTELESALAETAPLGVRALVKRGASWEYAGNDTLEHDWVPVPHLRSWAPEAEHASFRVELQRAVEERHLPDAFGVFAVPATDPPPGSAHWTATPAGPLTLWRHDDPKAWFGADVPNPGVLAAARADLRDLLP